jgi:hypothetical protein
MRFEGNALDIDIHGGSSPLISNNVLEGGDESGHGINARGQPVTIYNNTISNCGTGIIGSQVTVERNIIKNNHVGVDTFFSNPLISGNVIQNNEKGISGGGIIRNNSIANNVIAIENSVASPEIKYNNIVGSSDKSVYMIKNWGIDATYNWWGTTDVNAIEQSIHDVEDDFAVGKVTFEPFLTEPNPAIEPVQAGTPSPTSTPTPTPSMQETQLTLTCSSSTSSNLQVEISGRLSANGVGVANAPITLSYSLDNGQHG